MRDFTPGMHLNPTRDAIGEQDLWWLENMQPLASGNLANVAQIGLVGGTGAIESFQPYYTTLVYVGTQAYMFAAFPSTSAWIINLSNGNGTKIMPFLLSNLNRTYVVNWTGNNPAGNGFLIIDPNGYWDYNLTAPNTLTSLSGGIAGSTNVFKSSVAGGTTLKQITTGGGTGFLFQVHYQVIAVTINAAGAGYVVGDALSLTDNNPFTAAQIIVTSIGGGGTVTGINLAVGGDYPGPTTVALVATGPTGNVVTGGTGAGATFKPTIQATTLNIINPGNGWTGSPTLVDETGVPVVIDSWKLSIGVTSGTSIATYAGRVWIGSGNLLSWTNVNSYNNFSGAGGSITISDQYLNQGITVLYAANNYLYIFGATSVDVLSNVTVSATTGLTSFSRVNVLQGLGVIPNCNMTVTGFARGVVFLDVTGLYLLAGATPERISERIQQIIRNADFAGNFGGLPSCATTNINGELCLLFQIPFIDNYSSIATSTFRTVDFIYQRHRWWCGSNQYGNTGAAGPISGNPNFAAAFGVGSYAIVRTGASLWQAFTLYNSNTGFGAPWVLRTKFWDGGAAFREKQPLNVGIGALWSTPGPAQPTGVTFTVDSELQRSTPFTIPNIPTLQVGTTGDPGYAEQIVKGLGGALQGLGPQYIGLTFIGDGNQVGVLRSIALRAKTERNMLE